MIWILLLLTAYLAGSVPFGLIIGRARGIDIRHHGSGNIGATNVGRVLGSRYGKICFLLDMLKGAGPVVLAGVVMDLLGRSASELSHADLWLWLAVAVAAVLGHMASVFIGFKGGKGVATAFGAMVAMWPILTIPALAAIIIWYITLILTRYVSVASMLAALSLPLCAAIAVVVSDEGGAGEALTHAAPVLIVTGALALLVVYRHRVNIARLRRGEEPRSNSKV